MKNEFAKSTETIISPGSGNISSGSWISPGTQEVIKLAGDGGSNGMKPVL